MHWYSTPGFQDACLQVQANDPGRYSPICYTASTHVQRVVWNSPVSVVWNGPMFAAETQRGFSRRFCRPAERFGVLVSPSPSFHSVIFSARLRHFCTIQGC